MPETGVSEEGSNPKEKNSLLNYLINYLMREKRDSKRARSSLTVRISDQVYHDFDMVCRRLGLTSRGKTNVALEAALSFFVEQYRERPAVIQQTLTNVFVKAEQGSTVNVNVAQQLEVKIVKRELSYILEQLGTGSSERRAAYFVRALNGTLPKALKIYEKTLDPELGGLLKQSEKWV